MWLFTGIRHAEHFFETTSVFIFIIFYSVCTLVPSRERAASVVFYSHHSSSPPITALHVSKSEISTLGQMLKTSTSLAAAIHI